jgi:soluble lytic murein transglycosylase-like protein
VDSTALESALLRQHAHVPLARVLARRSGNAGISDRAAAAVLAEARRLRLSPSLVAAVLLVENTPMDTTAVSVAGAVGLMQVMPVHGGAMGCGSAELLLVESNICHGARVLKMYLRRTRTLPMALRRYNGCVGALTTRRCLRYPARVLRTASSIRREMLATPVPAGPPPPPPTYLSARPPVPTTLMLSSLLLGRFAR